MSSAAPVTSLLSVCDGQLCIGFVLNRGRYGFEAFDGDQQSLGIFPTQREAADAVAKRMPR
jgi:hypothetical protein